MDITKIPLKHLSTYVAIVVIFIYNNVIHKDLECTCEGLTSDCLIYMTLPCGILFFLQLWMEKKFQRALRYKCTKCAWCCQCTCAKKKYICYIFWYNILKAIFIGLLWAVSVLIDGDWYVCCWNDQSEQQRELSCKAETNITAEERKIIAKLKNRSWVHGIGLFGGALVLAALMSSFGWMHCVDRKIKYYKAILDEEENVLEKILTKAAQQKLAVKIKQKILEGPWEGCFDAAKELIEENFPPEFPDSADEELYHFTTLVQTAAAKAGAQAGGIARAPDGAADGAAARAAAGAAAAAEAAVAEAETAISEARKRRTARAARDAPEQGEDIPLNP